MLTEVRRKEILDALFAETDKGVKSPRVFICFAGIPASGKSTLAKKIKEEFGGTIVRGDRVFEEFLTEEEKNISAQERISLLFSSLQGAIESEVFGKNQLLILDSSVDRAYGMLEKYADSVGYSIYLISIDIPEEEIVARLKGRNSDEDLEKFIQEMPRRIEEHNSFLSEFKPDFVFRDDSQMDDLLSGIQEFLKSL